MRLKSMIMLFKAFKEWGETQLSMKLRFILEPLVPLELYMLKINNENGLSPDLQIAKLFGTFFESMKQTGDFLLSFKGVDVAVMTRSHAQILTIMLKPQEPVPEKDTPVKKEQEDEEEDEEPAVKNVTKKAKAKAKARAEKPIVMPIDFKQPVDYLLSKLVVEGIKLEFQKTPKD